MSLRLNSSLKSTSLFLINMFLSLTRWAGYGYGRGCLTACLIGWISYYPSSMSFYTNTCTSSITKLSSFANASLFRTYCFKRSTNKPFPSL